MLAFDHYFLVKKDVSDFMPVRSTLASLLFFLDALSPDAVGRFEDALSVLCRRSKRLMSLMDPPAVAALVGVLAAAFSFLMLIRHCARQNVSESQVDCNRHEHDQRTRMMCTVAGSTRLVDSRQWCRWRRVGGLQ
jgi:hypothetical protein